jgi:hypothetical protein
VREKLNESQAAQVGLVAVLVVVALVLFLKSSGGEEEAAESEAGPTVATVNGETATGATPGEAVEAAVAGLESGGAATASGVPTSVPAPPPPAEFRNAYESNQTVVLLIVHDGGIDDGRVSQASDAVAGMAGVTLIRVPLKQLPRYASVTVGLDVNRVPALVVMRPKKLSHGVPQATVDYGFQTTETVVQAVRDASYKGPEETYHPD